MNRIVLVAALASACVFHTESTIERADVEIGTTVDAIVLDIDSGEVSVVIGDVDRVQVNRLLRYGHTQPDIDAYTNGGTLILEARCPGLSQCSVDHEIILPHSASFEGSTGSGNVLIIGLTDDVTVDTGSGDVELDDIAGLVSVDTGSGDVIARGLEAPSILVDTGSGDVSLQLDARANDLFVSTGSGDVYAEVPAGTYRVKTDTGSGDVKVTGITTDRQASDHIEIDTGSGDIEIRGVSSS